MRINQLAFLAFCGLLLASAVSADEAPAADTQLFGRGGLGGGGRGGGGGGYVGPIFGKCKDRYYGLGCNSCNTRTSYCAVCSGPNYVLDSATGMCKCPHNYYNPAIGESPVTKSLFRANRRYLDISKCVPCPEGFTCKGGHFHEAGRTWVKPDCYKQMGRGGYYPGKGRVCVCTTGYELIRKKCVLKAGWGLVDGILMQCPAGTWNNGIYRACQSCGPNFTTYNPKDGLYCSGATSSSQCVCKPGYGYQAGSSSNGYYTTYYYAPSSKGSCTPCACPTQYGPGGGPTTKGVCLPCPNNFTVPTSSCPATSSSQCTIPPGCKKDSDCTNSTLGPICNLATGVCRACSAPQDCSSTLCTNLPFGVLNGCNCTSDFVPRKKKAGVKQGVNRPCPDTAPVCGGDGLCAPCAAPGDCDRLVCGSLTVADGCNCTENFVDPPPPRACPTNEDPICTDGTCVPDVVNCNVTGCDGNSTTPVCALNGTCVACSEDFGGTLTDTAFPCPSDTQPTCDLAVNVGACIVADCSTTGCDGNSTTPVCAEDGTCQPCTVDFGGTLNATSFPCPSDGQPVCDLTDNPGACIAAPPVTCATSGCNSTSTTPVCTLDGTCQGCNANNGGTLNSTLFPCPSTDLPTCDLNTGTCT